MAIGGQAVSRSKTISQQPPEPTQTQAYPYTTTRLRIRPTKHHPTPTALPHGIPDRNHQASQFEISDQSDTIKLPHDILAR